MIMQAGVVVAGANECFVLGSMQLELAVQMCVCPSQFQEKEAMF